MPNEDSPASGEVTREAVYREMYNECRRYRDYEFTSSSWYTALLLAILGFLVAARFGNTTPSFRLPLAESCSLKLAVVCGATAIAMTSNFLIMYSYGRYIELREYTTKHLEPTFKTDVFSPRRHVFVPRYVYYLTPWVVVALIAATTFATVPPIPASPEGNASVGQVSQALQPPSSSAIQRPPGRAGRR